jgi:hypothetical protein
MFRSVEFRLSAATCLVFFFMGAFTAPKPSGDTAFGDGVIPKTSEVEHVGNKARADPKGAALMSSVFRHAKAQKEFQAKIRSLQYSSECDNTRQLLVKACPPAVGVGFGEQFAREFHYLSLSLQVAVATGRMLVLDGEWQFLGKVNDQCTEFSSTPNAMGIDQFTRLRSIACLQQASISNCTRFDQSTIGTSSSGRSINLQSTYHLDPSLSFGIIPESAITGDNALFHADYYGPRRQVMEMPAWPFPRSTFLIDVVPTWERSMGRFWIRSQMVRYLWEKWQRDNSSLYSLPSTGSSGTASRPYVAFYWISCKKLRKNLATKFGRNASVTQDVARYMELANSIRERSGDSSLNTIYFITDGDSGVAPPEAFEKMYPNWQFVQIFAADETFSTNLGEEERTVASLELMQKADYLVGSFQSQMFRLGAELNAAWFAARYSPSMRRHWTLDVEWFENP